jgi:hypothetical protein
VCSCSDLQLKIKCCYSVYELIVFLLSLRAVRVKDSFLFPLPICLSVMWFKLLIFGSVLDCPACAPKCDGAFRVFLYQPSVHLRTRDFLFPVFVQSVQQPDHQSQLTGIFLQAAGARPGFGRPSCFCSWSRAVRTVIPFCS